MTRMAMLKRGAWHYLLLAFGSMLFGLFWLLRPMVKVRVVRLHTNRIGHLSMNTEIFLRRQARPELRQPGFHVFVTHREVANRQLLRMIRRRLFVLEHGWWIDLYETMQPRTPKAWLWHHILDNTNEYYEFNHIPPQLSFTPEEERTGHAVLTQIGVPQSAPFVCFHARDKSYMEAIQPWRPRQELRYHDFRDCDIQRYLPAARYLAAQGIYALRMGSVVEQPLPSTEARIIDYATEHRSDAGDIYLPANCKFFLANTSGIRLVSAIFDVPIALANSVPLGDVAMGRRDVFIPKTYWLVAEKRFLSFPEIIEWQADWWLRGERFRQAGIEVVENGADEIVELAQEMNERLDGTWVARDEDEALQRQFRALFPPGHRCDGFPSRMGASFLRRHRELMGERVMA